jgi:LPS-assembly protein
MTHVACAAWLALLASSLAHSEGKGTAAPNAANGISLTADPNLRMSSSLALPVAGPDNPALPVYFEADRIEGTPGERTKATGAVRLRRGDLTLRADEVTHTQADNLVQAQGQVRITRRGDVYSGPKLWLKLDTLQGEFTHPTYRFARTGAGGQAEQVIFEGPHKLTAKGATYTSCTPENTASADWLLSTSSVSMDFERNEGRAENAVIRFKGVPILAAPVLTFPLSDERKSGFLPPSFDIDNKSGFEFAQPYYWNIAPNRDATLTPTLSTRRGLGLETEFRYLEPHDQGKLNLVVLPHDRLAGRERTLIDMTHQGNLNRADSPTLTNYSVKWQQVSDDNYWKDFPRGLPSMTPRLYDQHLSVERQINTRAWGLGASQTSLYANVQSWQALQDLDPQADPSTRLIAPYRRVPQVGLRSRSNSESGWQWNIEGEFNRFTNEDASRASGNRLHALAHVQRPFGDAGWTLTPALSVNAASYVLDVKDGQPLHTATRLIPTASLDAVATFERPIHWLGQDLIQTLEPHAQYVYTPYKAQSQLPLFDSAVRDFNQYSIFDANAFTGVDRVSDANQLTLGLSSRFINPRSGVESLRVGVVQKVQFADQRVTPDDGPPVTQRLSDLLLLASSTVLPNWTVDTTVQYSSQYSRAERSLVGVRYSPGPWRTVSANYRYTRGSSEQIDLGWQWPLSGRPPSLDNAPAPNMLAAAAMDGKVAPRSTNECGGTWYSVGRMSYSLKDGRVSDALLGVEYDGGCWIGRVVAERVSVGRADASTRLMFQLELVGLSRLGSSPLRALKDNIPGYRLLREESSLIAAPSSSTDLNDE